MKRFSRIALGGLVALGLLAIVPTAAFAAGVACGDTLTVSTTLHHNLNCSSYSGVALTLGKKGITLDLNGYKIIGPNDDSSTSYGVYADGPKNVTVKNGKITGFYVGVEFDYVVNGVIKNLTITGDNTNTSTDSGVGIYYGANNKVSNITSTGNVYGIWTEYAAATWISNSTVSGAQYSFYAYYDTGDHFVNNHASAYTNYASSSSDGYGFWDEYSALQVYSANSANGGNAADTLGFYLYCDDYGPVTVTNNSATGNSDYGIETYYCYDDYNYIDGQVTLVSGNKASNNPGDGFYGYYSLHAVWTNNVANNNGDAGFYMDYNGADTFNGNTANGNGGNGIDVEDNYSGSYGNFQHFNNNSANNNDSYGIYAGYGVSNYSGNTAHGNGTAPDDCYNLDCN